MTSKILITVLFVFILALTGCLREASDYSINIEGCQTDITADPKSMAGCNYGSIKITGSNSPAYEKFTKDAFAGSTDAKK